jgi:hypothetical protein
MNQVEANESNEVQFSEVKKENINEVKFDNLSIYNVICNWCTYKGTHCRRNVADPLTKNKVNFCVFHTTVITEYTRITDPERLCDHAEDIKLVPRSYEHVKAIMKDIGNEDKRVDVYFQGGIVEEAKIKKYYIEITSDLSKYYYNKCKESKYLAKDLKILLKKHCSNKGLVMYDNKAYCQECYRKLNNCPRIHLLIPV